MRLSDKQFKIQGTVRRELESAFRNSRGFSYIALLAAIVIIGISLGAAGKYWSNISLRDKEEELLFRGDQYRQAIERYYLAIPGRLEYPSSVEDLLSDNRTSTGKRHLRQQYKDPITGEDFVLVRHTLTKRIIGVNSPSEKQPLKQANFPDPYNNKVSVPQAGYPALYNSFIEKGSYSEWVFVTTIAPTAATPAVAGFKSLIGVVPPTPPKP